MYVQEKYRFRQNICSGKIHVQVKHNFKKNIGSGKIYVQVKQIIKQPVEHPQQILTNYGHIS